MVIRSWDLAPKLTDKEFVFTPPKGAKKIEFLTEPGELEPGSGHRADQERNVTPEPIAWMPVGDAGGQNCESRRPIVWDESDVAHGRPAAGRPCVAIRC